MAGPNLSDELDLDAQILWSLFLASPIAAELRTGGGRGLLAKACGATEGQVFTWLRGEAMPPPHQARVFMAAACDRARAQASAEYRAASAPVPPASESTKAGALAEADRLHGLFPDWKVSVDGLESIATGRARLIWRAEHSGDWPDVYGVTAAELEGKLTGVERALADDRKRQEDARRTRGRRSVV